MQIIGQRLIRCLLYFSNNNKELIKLLFETNKDKGRAGMALGIAWFGANGYTVNIPLNDT